ncbi:uncharacterized protein [Apostichopus japonicus]|uniref:uncharacterized protein isoform X2 n=1 Tax=Stichopus japonicus TaxID=307972 RepID=UPI003AB54E50
MDDKRKLLYIGFVVYILSTVFTSALEPGCYVGNLIENGKIKWVYYHRNKSITCTKLGGVVGMESFARIQSTESSNFVDYCDENTPESNDAASAVTDPKVGITTSQETSTSEMVSSTEAAVGESAAVQQEVSCPSGWVGYGGNCYKLWSSDLINWDDAHTKCRDDSDSRLATVDTEEELTFLQNMDLTSSYYWIAYRATVSASGGPVELTFSNGNASSSFLNALVTTTTNDHTTNQEGCLTVSRNDANDALTSIRPCYDNNPFVCKKTTDWFTLN